MRGVAKTSANSGLGQIGAPERQATCGPQAVPDPEAAERHANLLAEQMEEARDRQTVWSHQFVESREVRGIAAEPLDYARCADRAEVARSALRGTARDRRASPRRNRVSCGLRRARGMDRVSPSAPQGYVRSRPTGLPT